MSVRRPLTLIALVAGLLLPAAGAIGAPGGEADDTGIGIRLVDAPVATRDDPRAQVYIIDHVKPGTTIERRIEVSNNTGDATDVDVYAAAAAIRGGSFVGLEADTPNELTTWTTVGTPRLSLADDDATMVDITITVPDDASSGEQYAVLWAQTSSPSDDGAIRQVSRVGIRVYLSVGPGGAPPSAFEIESFTAARDPEGRPVVEASVRNTGGRALDLRGELMLDDGPAGLSAGPFAVVLGTTLAIDAVASVTVPLDHELPAGPWRAHLSLTSGLLTEDARAELTFPTSGTGPTVAVAEPASPLRWVGVALGLLALGVGFWWLLRRRRRRAVPVPRPRSTSHRKAADAASPHLVGTNADGRARGRARSTAPGRR